MSERAAYSRVYWEIVDDPKFMTIFDHDATLAAWLRLLLIADQAYPASAHLPLNIRRSALSSLVDAGLVDLVPGQRFRLHGLEAERERRRAAATSRGQRPNPSGDQTVTVRSPNGSYTRGLSQAEDKTSLDEPRHIARDPADIYWRLTGKYPGDKALPWIDQLAERYGSEEVCRALATAFIADRSQATLLGRTQDALRAEARVLDRKERDAEQARLREKRAQPTVLEPWKEEYRRLIQEQYEVAS